MEMNVEAGKTYLIRVVGAGTISMVSLCFGVRHSRSHETTVPDMPP